MKRTTRSLALLSAGLLIAVATPIAQAVTRKTTSPKTVKKTVKTVRRAVATTAPAPKPTTAAVKTGGKAVWGLEAESSEGFLPSSSNCAISCYQVFTTIAERLLSVDAKGATTAWLADSVTPDPTYKVWTIKLKPGIRFHDGEPFDADAVKLNIDDFACGSVTLSAWFPLNGYGTLCKAGKLTTGVASDGKLTVTVTLPARWVSLPSYLASGQTYMMAPAQIRSGDRNKPIGTGNYRFKEWTVGDHLTVVKNTDYWGTPANLDEITFRPIPDESARIAQLQSGQIDFMQTSNMLTIGELRKLAASNRIRFDEGSPTFGEVSYDMLNNGVAPFNNENCRLAAAHGQDVDTLIALRSPGSQKANGPFPPGAIGYLANTGYPTFDLAKAKGFFAKCKAELGGGDVSFTLGTTTVPDNIQTAQIQKQMMEAVGFKVSMINIEQQKYIGVALVGAYQWFQWRSHGGFDPDQQRVWWHNEMNPRDKAGNLVFDGKTIDIDLARIADPTIDAAFDQIRTSSDPAVRRKAAENINSTFGENANNLWRWRTTWGVASCAKCSGVTNQTTPTGQSTQDFPTGLVVNMGALSKG